MVTSDPGNASAFSQNAVIYNDEIVGSFLKDHLDLPNLKGCFYRHILLATDQPDAVLAYRGEEKKLKGEVECRNQDSICMAAMNMLKKLISKQLHGKLISCVNWKQLPQNLIKWTLSIKNCPLDFVTMLEKGADIYSTSQWQSLYDALGGADPDGEYAQHAQVPSSRLVDVTMWTSHDLALDPSSDDYRNIVLIQDDSGLGGIGGVTLLFIKDVMKDSSMRPQKRHTVPSSEDAGNCSHPSTSTSSKPKKIRIMLPSSRSDDGPSHLGLFQVPRDMDVIQSPIGLHSHMCFEPSNPHTFSSSVPPKPGPFVTSTSILDPPLLSTLDSLFSALRPQPTKPPISL